MTATFETVEQDLLARLGTHLAVDPEGAALAFLHLSKARAVREGGAAVQKLIEEIQEL